MLPWGRHIPKLRLADLPSSLTRNHSFALVCSTCLPVSVLGTDSIIRLEAFLGRYLGGIVPFTETFPVNSELPYGLLGISPKNSFRQEHESNNVLPLLTFVTPSHILWKGRNINRLSIPVIPSDPGLGPPNPWLIDIAKETLGFRRSGLSPDLWLLMPTFSLPAAPPHLTV